MTAPLATIIIPIAPYHLDIAQRAIQSAAAQTVACTVLPIVDHESKGAGWARNRGIERATTEFVVFLDADDVLMPGFVERCWRIYQQTGRYVYTDFIEDNGTRHDAPDCAWVDDTWHAVTALVPTAWAREIDGFDEALHEGGEDSEFYMHLCSEGRCGIRLPEALFVYTNTPDGRSSRWRNTPAFEAYYRLIHERYLNKGKTAMGCCTEPAKLLQDPNAPAPQMVLARPRWGGNRRERGLITGTLYPPADRSQVIEMDPRDVEARKDLFEVVAPVIQAPPKSTPEVKFTEDWLKPYLSVNPMPTVPTPDLSALAKRALQIKPPPAAPSIPPPPAPVVPTTPNVNRVVQIAQSRVIPRSGDGGWYLDGTGSVEIYKPGHSSDFTQDSQHTRDYSEEVIEKTRVFVARTYPLVKRSGEPVFVFPDTDYPSYTDVRSLITLSGFDAVPMSVANWNDASQVYILLTPEPLPIFEQKPAAKVIAWELEYGGAYAHDYHFWKEEVWASDLDWAAGNGARFVVLGSHPGLGGVSEWTQKEYDVSMLSYMTPRRQVIKDQLATLNWDPVVYPGYGETRAMQLYRARLMLHVHQYDGIAAIAPQRIAVAAAYHLPMIHEQVTTPGDYSKWIPFIAYEHLNAEVRSQLAMYEMGLPQQRGEMLHEWLCKEWTFRRCVEAGLK